MQPEQHSPQDPYRQPPASSSPPQPPTTLPPPIRQLDIPETLPVDEVHPFIEPRLDYDSPRATGIRAFFNRKMLIVFALLVLVGGGVGVFALIRGSADDQRAPVATTDDNTYEGDGSDITSSVFPDTEWQCPEDTVASGEGNEMECTGTFTDTRPAKKTVACPSGYTKSTNNDGKTQCQRAVNATRQTQNASVSYSCPSGYTRSGTRCSKVATYPVTTVYTCPSGYTKSGSGTTTKCTRTLAANATKRYSCPSGYTKIGSGADTRCRRIVSVRADGTCPRGYVKRDGRCVRTINPTVTTVYSCPSGYTKVGSGTSTRCTRTIAATAVKRCPSGYTLSGSVCRRTVTTSATKHYSCPAGYSRDGGTCYRYIGGNVQTATPITKYTCPSGYKRNGETCEKKVRETRPAEEVYVCDEGWELLEEEDAEAQCVKIEE